MADVAKEIPQKKVVVAITGLSHRFMCSSFRD